MRLHPAVIESVEMYPDPWRRSNVSGAHHRRDSRKAASH